MTFHPVAKGPRKTTLLTRQRPSAQKPAFATLTGVGIGPVGAELLINVAGGAVTADNGELWSIDYGFGSYHIAGSTQHIGISTHLSRFKNETIVN